MDLIGKLVHRMDLEDEDRELENILADLACMIEVTQVKLIDFPPEL